MPRYTSLSEIYRSVFVDLTPLVQALFRSSLFFWHFFSSHINGKKCNLEGFCPYCSQISVVCAYDVLSPSLKGFVWSKYLFWPNIITEMGVVIYRYLKNFPDYIDSKYIWVHGSNSLSSSVFAKNSIFGIFSLHRERKKCGQVGSSPSYFHSEVVYTYQVLNL